MPRRHVFPLRVRYAECDPQNVVFNAHYLAYFDLAVTELWRASLGSYQAMVDAGFDVVVAEATVRYRSPARFDDVLAIAIEVARLGTTSMRTEYRVTRDDDLLAEGEVTHVFVSTADYAKTPIPEWIRAALGHGEGVVADGAGAGGTGAGGEAGRTETRAGAGEAGPAGAGEAA